MKMRKELWFGFAIMALVVAGAVGMLLGVETVTRGHLGLLMLVKPPATHAATTYTNGKR